jgi:hypothetical protein
VLWDSEDSEDAADSSASDLDDEPRECVIARSDVDYGTAIYPAHELGREHHGCKVWGLFAVVSEADGDWWPELVAGGMTLDQARNLAEDKDVSRLLS